MVQRLCDDSDFVLKENHRKPGHDRGHHKRDQRFRSQRQDRSLAIFGDRHEPAKGKAVHRLQRSGIQQRLRDAEPILRQPGDRSDCEHQPENAFEVSCRQQEHEPGQHEIKLRFDSERPEMQAPRPVIDIVRVEPVGYLKDVKPDFGSDVRYVQQARDAKGDVVNRIKTQGPAGVEIEDRRNQAFVRIAPFIFGAKQQRCDEETRQDEKRVDRERADFGKVPIA